MKRNILSVLIALASIGTACAQETQFLSSNHCLYRIQQKDKCMLLPVQESAETVFYMHHTLPTIDLVEITEDAVSLI